MMGGNKVTEMLKDEREGSEIINHYKLRERDTPWNRGLGASSEQLCSSPTRLQLLYTFLVVVMGGGLRMEKRLGSSGAKTE